MTNHTGTSSFNFTIGVYVEDTAIDPHSGDLDLRKVIVYPRPARD